MLSVNDLLLRVPVAPRSLGALPRPRTRGPVEALTRHARVERPHSLSLFSSLLLFPLTSYVLVLTYFFLLAYVFISYFILTCLLASLLICWFAYLLLRTSYLLARCAARVPRPWGARGNLVP